MILRNTYIDVYVCVCVILLTVTTPREKMKFIEGRRGKDGSKTDFFSVHLSIFLNF
jgi:hypothetical protein